MLPPAWIGTRKGSVRRTSSGNTAGRRAIENASPPTRASATTAPATARIGWRCTKPSWGECQISASSSTGASTRAASIAAAPRACRRSDDEHSDQQRGGHDAGFRRRPAQSRDRHHPRDDPLFTTVTVPMLSVKPAAAVAVMAVVLSACASTAKPPQGHGKVDDPRTNNPNRLACLRQLGSPHSRRWGETGIQIGTLPSGPTIEFTPTPGIAQGRQIQGQAEGAEVIGAALLYPHQAGDSELTGIENCLAKDVTG